MPPGQPPKPFLLDYGAPPKKRPQFAGLGPFAAATAGTSLLIAVIEMLVPRSPIRFDRIDSLDLRAITSSVGTFTAFGTTIVSMARHVRQRYLGRRSQPRSTSAHVLAGCVYATVTVCTFVGGEVVRDLEILQRFSLLVLVSAGVMAGCWLVKPLDPPSR